MQLVLIKFIAPWFFSSEITHFRCADSKLNDCDKMAKCVDTTDSYLCQCPANSRDISPNPAFSGRVCLICKFYHWYAFHESKAASKSWFYRLKLLSKIWSILIFIVQLFLFITLVENECLNGKHDCDPNAICRDNEQSFTCECAQGFADRSPNQLNRPGRVCIQVILAYSKHYYDNFNLIYA